MAKARTLREAINEVLSPRGYLNVHGTWNRRQDSFIEVVDLQRSKDGVSEAIECGVLDAEVYDLAFSKPVPSFTRIVDCTVRARLGRLVGGTDRWWLVSDPRSSADAVLSLKQYGLPFIAEMHDRAAMIKRLQESVEVKRRIPPEILYFGLLNWTTGRRTEACALFRSLISEQPWGRRAEAIHRALGCSDYN
jgi:hypothetical protein